MNTLLSTPRPHPWLERFRREPYAALDDMLRGLARVHPYERGTPSDILKRLFGTLAKSDPDLCLLDETLRSWLEKRLCKWTTEQIDVYGLPRFVTETMDSLAVVWLV